jgi:hypothetical protein
MSTKSGKPAKKKTKKSARVIIIDEPLLPDTIIIPSSTNKTDDESCFLTLHDVNTTAIDKNYAITDILEKKPISAPPEEIEPRRKMKSVVKTTIEDKKKSKDVKVNRDELKSMSTSLEKLGISTTRKDPAYLMYWGEQYKIRLFVSSGFKEPNSELTPACKIKCFNCHQFPPEGALMLSVPWRYVPSYIERNDYSPEWINVVPCIKVERSIKSANDTKANEGKQNQRKVPKTTYLKRDLPRFECEARIQIDESQSNEQLIIEPISVTTELKESNEQPIVDLVSQDYFDTENPVCSFNCMVTEGHRLRDKDHNSRFRNVDMYIAMLYQRLFGSLPPKIRPASKFSILQEYGGSYSLEEYRKEFTFATLEETGQMFARTRALINPSISLLRSN